MYDQPDAQAVHALDRVLDGLADKLPAVAEHLEGAREDILAFTVFPKEIWRQIWSNNSQKRRKNDLSAHRRRVDLPNGDAIIRLVGAVRAEQHDEWAEQRRYLSLDALTRTREALTAATPASSREEVTEPALVCHLTT